MTQSHTSHPNNFSRRATPDCSLAYMGSVLSVLASTEETGGQLSLMLAHARQGSEPPPHIHEHENEFIYMLDGQLEFFLEDEAGSFIAGPGEGAMLPAARAHAISFLTPEVRMLVVVSATKGEMVGLEAYFRLMAVGPATSMSLPAMATQYSTASPAEFQSAARVADAHGITFLSPEQTLTRLPSYPGMPTRQDALKRA